VTAEPRATEPRETGQLRHVDRPGGIRIAYRVRGAGIPVCLLHGTLSTGGQLGPLARELVAGGDLRVIVIDRRGSGQSRLAVPQPIDVRDHIGDIEAVLDAERLDATVFVGHSFGGAVSLEFAARRPERTLAVVVYEPPYAPVADEPGQREFAAIAAATKGAWQTGGNAAAAEAFLRIVAGDSAWDDLPERSRRFLEDEGGGALTDVLLVGLDPAGLPRISVPVTLLTGGLSEPMYAGIADALARRIPGARRVHFPDFRHPAPITDPVPIAAAVRAALVRAGIVETA
jgi:pimeloyl-ACP methyl ester carboxylesterase